MESWNSWYRKIVEKLGLDEEADELAAKILNVRLPKPDLREFSRILKDRECLIFGAGPSLDEDLLKLDSSGWLDKVLIAADGATSAVLKYRVPHIVATDLDGKIKDQLEAWRRGAWLVLHAHGDNIPRLKKIAPKLGERVIGTTQVRPFGMLFNFGGFTDGDRAAFMAHELGASKIYLAGMDLGREVGRHSGAKDRERKLIKLEICKELLTWLATGLGARIVNLTSRGEPIPGIPFERF